MPWMSPNDLNADRKRWLDIPHELHAALLRFMQKIYPDFSLDGIHCFECEGVGTMTVVNAKTGKIEILNGVVEPPASAERLYHTLTVDNDKAPSEETPS